MLFIRTSDDTEILNKDGVIKFINGKRKGNIVTKFKIDDDGFDLQFFEDELITKMIPKKTIDTFREMPIQVINTQSKNSLLFQNLNTNVFFLTINSSTGHIEKILFDDLVSQEDSILCYDGEDWYLNDVDCTYLLWDENLKNDMQIAEPMLSNYIISAEQDTGLIINNLMIL